MLCYVMLCYVMLCYVMLYRVMLCCVVLCYNRSVLYMKPFYLLYCVTTNVSVNTYICFINLILMLKVTDTLI